MKKYIRLYTFLSVFMLLVSCGGGQADVEKDVPAVVASVTTTGARIITHPLGETEVPSEPQRIVSLNAVVTDNLIALGITPVGITTFTGSDFESYEYLAETLQSVAIVGTFAEPNQEAILQLDPYLIVGRDEELRQTYATLSEIAPTVAVKDQSDFRSWLRQVAAVVGRETEVEEQIAMYEAQVAEVGAAIREMIGDETVAFLRVQPHSIRIHSNQRLGGPILYHDLGIAQPSFVEAIADDTSYIEISLEELHQLAAAEHIFLLDQSQYDDPSPVFSSLLWESLPAVQNGQVYPATRDTWINLGFLAAEHMVETREFLIEP